MSRRPRTAPTLRKTRASDPMAAGGALEGAERSTRETVNWYADYRTADMIINPLKQDADARAADLDRNDGATRGGTRQHQDNIVGPDYRLNCTVAWQEVPGATQDWADKFESATERKFHLYARSDDNWFDASGKRSFTEMIRLATAQWLLTGESFGTGEWLNKDLLRPFNTAVMMISADRLCNPNDSADTWTMRRGVERDDRGKPIAYHIRNAHPAEHYMGQDFPQWIRVPTKKPWGRRQVIHIHESLAVDQSRGVADIVSVLKQMKMTKTLSEVTLQNAVVQASYAAAIESELPAEVISAAMGGTNATDPQNGFINVIGAYQTVMDQYYSGGKNVTVDGVRIPIFMPGSKLNVRPLGTPGGVNYADYHASLLRHIASAFGLSYEQFANDFSRVSYSSARASMLQSWKYMQSQKALVADSFATAIYRLWLEEQIAREELPMPNGWTRSKFYESVLTREALYKCEWIGAARGQIDEVKETEAAVMRVKNFFSTYKRESARLGHDFGEDMAQMARDRRVIAALPPDPTIPVVEDSAEPVKEAA